MRTAAEPDQALLEFLQSTYEAAANAAKWDRDALECAPGRPGVVRQIEFYISAFFARGRLAERAVSPRRQPRIAAQLARGAIAQRIGQSAPAQRRGDIDQRQSASRRIGACRRSCRC